MKEVIFKLPDEVLTLIIRKVENTPQEASLLEKWIYDGEERKEAEWLPEEFFPYKGFYCSNPDCMEKVYDETPYCPYCGAKMKGVEE